MLVEELYILTLSIIVIAVNIGLIVRHVKPMEGTFIGLFLVIILLLAYSTLKVSVVQTVSIYNTTTNTTITKEVYGDNPFATIILVPLIITLGIMFYNIGRWIIDAVGRAF